MSEFAEGLAVGMNENRGYNGGFGNGWGDGWWILLLLLCGWGNNGWGNNGQNTGYELGKLATTNDVASGFSTSTIMSTQRDSQLAMQQGFSDVQQTLCQGFSGVNQSLMNGFHGVDNAICNLGYNVQAGINGLSRELGDCCCTTQRAIDNLRFENEKNTRDIIDSQRCGTDRILAYLSGQELDRLRAENQGLRFQASQAAQNAYLVDVLRPTARPAYITCSPYESAFGRNGCGCGC